LTRPSDAIGGQKAAARGPEPFLSFGTGERFQYHLRAFEKLDEADTLDVFGGEPLVALGTDELERSQAAHALDRLPGSGAQPLSRQLRSRAFFHAAPPASEHDRRCVKTCQPRSLA